MKRFSFILWVFFVAMPGRMLHAQKLNRAKLDSLLTAIEIHDKGFGSVAMLEDGQVIFKRGYGFSNLEKKRKNEAGTLFRIGSISKTYTATLAMLAVEDGLLSLDDYLSKYYPKFQNADKITIRQLLQHRSGLKNFTDSPEYGTYMTEPKSKEELLQILISEGISFEPGQQFEYSNTGYVVLTFIIEDVFEAPFGKVLQDRVIKPLGLENTYYQAPNIPMEMQAISYAKTSEWLELPFTDLSVPRGAGAIVATASDVGIFFNALFQGEIVSEASWQQMIALQDNFGMGLFAMPYDSRQILGHTGGVDAFQSIALHFEKEKLTIALLCNGVDFSRNDILLGLLAIYFDKDYSIPTFDPEEKLDSELIARLEGNYTAEGFPLAIKVFGKDARLMAQATGQPAFPLTKVEDMVFIFAPANLKMSFTPENNSFLLEQNGMKFTFNKQ